MHAVSFPCWATVRWKFHQWAIIIHCTVDNYPCIHFPTVSLFFRMFVPVPSVCSFVRWCYLIILQHLLMTYFVNVNSFNSEYHTVIQLIQMKALLNSRVDCYLSPLMRFFVHSWRVPFPHAAVGITLSTVDALTGADAHLAH